jgi:hypothetical protein
MAGEVSSMIQLKPTIALQVVCPNCKNNIQPSDWLITGMHCIMHLACTHCSGEYYSEIPVNAGLFYPGILDAKTGERKDDLPFDNWYLNGLQQAYKNRSKDQIKVEVHQKRPFSNRPVLLLNTIDATYGHALYELFNASYYLKKDEFDLVIIVQKNLHWLVPEGVAQVWVVDISFGKAVNWFDQLSDQFKDLLKNVDSVFLCRSFVQADSTDFDIRDYAKIHPFPLENWDERLVRPTITFIWRTDRFWKRVLPKWVDNRYSRKIAGGALNKWRGRSQFNWILRFGEKLKREIPDIDFAIAGMDERTPRLPGWIKDFRYPTHEDATARMQLERYAESHLVVGCNGSSLLLPGCLSGGIINIVPGSMWAVSAGTFPFRVTDTGDTQFRYVMLPDEISMDRLLSIIVSVLRDRSYIQLQASHPWRDHDSQLPPYAWAEFRKKISYLSDHFQSEAGLVSTRRNKTSETGYKK